MKVITFPFILDAGDGGYYFLNVSSEEEGMELAKMAEDCGYMFEEPKVLDTISNAPAIYDALSRTKYESLGYTTKEELFAAYESDPDLEDSSAYSLDGYEPAVIGVTESGDRFVYDFNKMIDLMITRDEMSYEDAMEWYSYNIERSFPYYQPCPIILVSLE